jgi:hypothetical protein
MNALSISRFLPLQIAYPASCFHCLPAQLGRGEPVRAVKGQGKCVPYNFKHVPYNFKHVPYNVDTTVIEDTSCACKQ